MLRYLTPSGSAELPKQLKLYLLLFILEEEFQAEAVSNMTNFLWQAHSGKALPHDLRCFAHSSVTCSHSLDLFYFLVVYFFLSRAEWKLKRRAADQERPAEARWTLHLHGSDNHRQRYRLGPAGCEGWVMSGAIAAHIFTESSDCIWKDVFSITFLLGASWSYIIALLTVSFGYCAVEQWEISMTHTSVSRSELGHICIKMWPVTPY